MAGESVDVTARIWHTAPGRACRRRTYAVTDRWLAKRCGIGFVTIGLDAVNPAAPPRC